MSGFEVDLEELAANSSSDEIDDGPKYERLYPPPSTGGGTSASSVQSPEKKIQLKQVLETKTQERNAPSDPRLMTGSIIAPPPSPMSVVMDRAARFGTADQPGGPGATPLSSGSTSAIRPPNGMHAVPSSSENRTQGCSIDPRSISIPVVPIYAPHPSPESVVMERTARFFGMTHQPWGPGATPLSAGSAHASWPPNGTHAVQFSSANQGTMYRNRIPDEDAQVQGQSIPNAIAPKLSAGYINR
jgi:hypothetical protein